MRTMRDKIAVVALLFTVLGVVATVATPELRHLFRLSGQRPTGELAGVPSEIQKLAAIVPLSRDMGRTPPPSELSGLWWNVNSIPKDYTNEVGWEFLGDHTAQLHVWSKTDESFSKERGSYYWTLEGNRLLVVDRAEENSWNGVSDVWEGRLEGDTIKGIWKQCPRHIGPANYIWVLRRIRS